VLAGHLQSLPPDRRNAPALLYGSLTLTYGELARQAEELAARWRALAGLRVGLALDDPARYLPAVVALDSLHCHAYLAGRRDASTLEQLAHDLRWDAVIDDLTATVQPRSARPATGAAPTGGRVTLLTSGTTGGPKAANHSWSTLAAPVRRDPRYADTRWLCAYPLNLYAGTQVMLQALLNWATLVIPESLDPATVVQAMRDHAVTHAGGTPTFWRQLLLFAPRDVLAACPLQQLTMGGEAATQGLLDQLGALFPAARLVHIYASTELGRLFSVADRREGFPAAFLEKSPEAGIELRIDEDELFARSVNAMLGYEGAAAGPADAGWMATGDLVERQGDRILFRGRKSDLINVGGRKVLPARVESVLREVPGVADVRVYGKGSSLAGQIVAADIVLAPGSDRSKVLATINSTARERLGQAEIPRLVRVVDAIAHSSALKVTRREEP